MSRSETITKHVSQMTTEELKAAANRQALEFYKNRAEENPSDEATQAEYNNFCLLQGLDPSTGKRSRFESMTKDQIGAEWAARGKAVEANELEAYREQQAKIWMASQKGYVPTPEAAAKIIGLIDRMGLRGSVADLQLAWDTLCEKGELQAPPQPVPLYTREQLSQMSAADCRAALNQMGFDSI